MIAITTIDTIPEGCNDNCICCHDGWCYAIHTGNGDSFDYQEAQQIRPYNCPLMKIEVQEQQDGTLYTAMTKLNK